MINIGGGLITEGELVRPQRWRLSCCLIPLMWNDYPYKTGAPNSISKLKFNVMRCEITHFHWKEKLRIIIYLFRCQTLPFFGAGGLEGAGDS